MKTDEEISITYLEENGFKVLTLEQFNHVKDFINEVREALIGFEGTDNIIEQLADFMELI